MGARHVVADGASGPGDATWATLEPQLAAVRRQGYACSLGETNTGIGAVAVPVWAAGGTVRAALAVSMPIDRLPDERIAELAAALRRCAARLSATH